ncbi:uncharacterized protein LOC114353131 [Ostrinia furnacalis]|uniref:uncharacterized protein LOC114353131 n=1 Tax=Ostrinia furnacalis TaxID=93504 RepID=UPI00103DD983|nr:uncharacterized protein LOC114353131 [Ostrinia furnacalis]
MNLLNFFKKYTEDDLINIKEHHFESFNKTYQWIAFTLTLGIMFPNPATDRFRIISINVLLVCVFPLAMMVLIDMYKCWMVKDIFNIIRHSTIVGPFLGAFFKMFLMYYKRAQAKEILDEINRDHASFNFLPRKQQDIAFLNVKKGVFNVERLWAPIVSIAIMTFPGMAVVMTLYSYAFSDNPKRYMIHEVKPPNSRDPEDMLKSPYFEILFVYETGSAIICVLNYTAYDGLFGIATNHACLKMSLCCMKLKEAFRCDSTEDMYKGILTFIEEQKKMFRFVDLIQDTFNIWLGTILTSTMIQIGSLLFHISAGYGFDLRYTLFSFTSVVHIFLPCKNAATLKDMSTEMSTMIYSSGWERSRERRILRMIPFMVARAQVPNYITAFNLFIFDMELFVFILRTSYSMYTLIRS